MIWTRTVNEVIIVWWIANDPVLKDNKNSQKLVVFNLATRRVWLTKEWEKKEEVQYHKIAAWWRLAEKAAKILNKWVKVYIRWYLHNRKIQIESEDKSRTITEVVLNDLLVLSRKKIDDDASDDEDLVWDEDFVDDETSQ